MKPTLLTLLTVAATWTLVALPETVRAQSGWVSTINPGWVSAPLPGAAQRSPGVPQSGGGAPVQQGRVVAPPAAATLGAAGTGEAAITSPSPGVFVYPPAPVIYPPLYPANALNHYIYPTNLVGLDASTGQTRDSTAGSPEGRIFIGMTRTAVIETLGRPSAIVLRASDETLVFTGTTIVIQNGVVAIIQ